MIPLRQSLLSAQKFCSRLDLREIPAAIRLVLAVATIASLLIASGMLVYETGGTSNVYVHVFYVSILVGTFFFGISGGVIVGLAAGLICGPYMPLNTITGETQTTINWLMRTGFFILMGVVAGFIVEALRRQARLLRQSTHRSKLTGLPNQIALEQDINQRIRQTYRSGKGEFLVAELGISSLNQMMVTFGHARATELLIVIDENLKRSFPDVERIYHVQADRYAIVVPDDSFEKIRELCEKIIAAIKRPLELSGLPIIMNGCVGLSRYPTHGMSGAELSRAAHFALHMAETTKQDYLIFDRMHDEQRRQDFQLLGELKEAILKDELIFNYQPKLDLRAGKTLSVEALVRWPHPSGKILPPGAFIPAAENTALITQLSAWGLKTAISQVNAWQRKGIHRDVGIAVNLSPTDLQNGMTVEIIKELLALYDVDPTRLEIEVTETAIINDIDVVTRCLRQMRSLGVRIAIDDFGTGHAGLAQLRNLPVDVLKIDRTFVANMTSDMKDDLIVRSAIDLGHNFDLEIVAEGVETEEVMTRLREYGCDTVQGYGIARPMPESDLQTWLSDTERRAPFVS